MKLQFTLGALIVAIPFLWAASAGDGSRSPSDDIWIGDYQEGLDKAKKENKPIFLEFR